MAFLWHFKYNADANNRKQIIHMHARTTSNKHTNTHLCNSQTPFMCGLMICEPPWLSVNTFYASIGTDTVSSHSKWFYKQFTEAWCLFTWNPLPLSLTYYHWYNLFAGDWSIDQWSLWFIPSLTLKTVLSLFKESRSAMCLYPLDIHLDSKPQRSPTVETSKLKLFVSQVFSRYFWFWLNRF